MSKFNQQMIVCIYDSIVMYIVQKRLISGSANMSELLMC